jgi:hypothetical protein
MATTNTEVTSNAISKVNLWFKIKGIQPISLSDMPKLIKFKWQYFKDNWSNIRQDYINQINTYSNPYLLKKTIEEFDSYIDSHRNMITNPFMDVDVLYKFFAVFDVTDVNQPVLTKEEKDIFDTDVSEINSMIRSDFLDLRKQIILERDLLTDKVGLTDSDYNTIYSRSPAEKQTSVNNRDLNTMYSYQNAIDTVNFILANAFSLDSVMIDPYAVAKANAKNPGVQIGSYKGGNLKRFNYGESLSDISARELGDSNKWMDVAIANGLKPPYIDETGAVIPLLSNANGNQINIAATTDNILNIDRLYINQIVLLKSNTSPFPEQRIIRNIKEAPVSGELIIELDGEIDLDRYKTSDSAYIRIFKPNTINSSFMIMIPSNEPLTDIRKSETPWFLVNSSESEKRQKIDLLVDDLGDLVLDSTNDLQLSYGLNNAIQSIKLKMSIETGELKKHPSFGFTAVQGLTNSNIKGIKDILTNSIQQSIKNDDRFDRIETLTINYIGGKDLTTANAFNISMEVKMAGGSQVIPLSFTVNI